MVGRGMLVPLARLARRAVRGVESVSMNGTNRAETSDRAALRATPGLATALAACLLLPACAHGQAGVEELDRPDGQRIAGRIEGDVRSGFRFAPRGGGPPIALEPGAVIRREGQGQGPGPGALPAAPAGLPPFHLLVGEAARLSGSLRTLTGSEVRFAPAWQPGEVTMPRACLQAIVQRPGEARVLADGFETIDAARWSVTGIAATADRTRPGAGRVLRLTAQGTSSLTHNLEDPLAAGRLELAFHDDGKVARGHECVVEPVFRGPSRRAAIRIILGWSEDSPAVESPGVTSLQVQRLVRTSGWHRLTLRFGPEETEIAVDGQELAHGRGPEGPLTAITLSARSVDGPTPANATATATATATDRPPSAEFDDLLLIRFVEPPASVEIDPTQDEARLVVGDQLFGEVRGADANGMDMAVNGRPIAMRWGEVAGLYLRRVPDQGAPVEGLLVRAEWRTAPGDRDADLDFAEGALLALSEDSLTLATPYAGTLTIPRAPLCRLDVLGRGRRVVVDDAAHHLGDEVSVTHPLDPPQPEALALDRSIELPAAPDGPAELVLDVIGVVPEAGDPRYSIQVRNGELRSYVAVNGRRLDYLNRHVTTRNEEAPERIRIPIPRGLLHAGKNAVRIELTGDSDPRPKYDDLGILQVAVEFPASAAAPAPAPRDGGPGAARGAGGATRDGGPRPAGLDH